MDPKDGALALLGIVVLFGLLFAGTLAATIAF
jgi:hypothetical protein